MGEPSLHDWDYERWSERRFKLDVEDERDVDSIPGESTADFYASRARESFVDLSELKKKESGPCII